MPATFWREIARLARASRKSRGALLSEIVARAAKTARDRQVTEQLDRVFSDPDVAREQRAMAAEAWRGDAFGAGELRRARARRRSAIGATTGLAGSRALWNRVGLDLRSDEILAQILDRGSLADWRELYRLASGSTPDAAQLRRRILRLCRTVPLPAPHLFIAAMAHLGEPVDPYPTVPPYE
jgi:hypothetical protein